MPSEAVQKLLEYGLKRWDVTRRIQCMNKNLVEKIGGKLAEKRGRKWAGTPFLFEV